MITFTVIAFNDAPADGTLQAHFDELGGTIGRAATNQLVLPDPERMVSRVAAQVVFRNGSFAIIDRGSNPIVLNGRALASGLEAPLNSGDHLHICGYELSVSIGQGGAAPMTDPFSGLLGPAVKPTPRGASLIDPLDRPGPGGAARAAPGVAGPGVGIPVDWDPFAPPSVVGSGKPAQATPPRRDALGLDIGGASPAALIPGMDTASPPGSLDQLFGLSPSLGRDPLANSALDAPMAQPNTAADESDPLRALQSAPRASGAPVSDQLSDLHRPFIPPMTIKPPAAAQGSPPAAAAAWVKTTPAGAAQASSSAPARAAGASPAAGAGDGGALLQAFRRGLNAPTVELPSLTPALMELIGQLLHEAVRGTVDLLRARTTVKHELRADMTRIVAKDNNPLKFSPNAEVALQHLLAPPARGFIPAAPAMRDAYEDLRAHQFAFVAGMQAILEAALQRLDPAVLESQLGDRSLMHSLVPASRHARLWEMFGEHYARICSEATSDFHASFGAAFLAAYDEHVKRLQERDVRRTEA